MTRDESLQVVAKIVNLWKSNQAWTKDEIDAYARAIEDLDMEITVSAVDKAAKDMAYRPKISELRELVRLERRRLSPVVAPPDEPKTTPAPSWVKRWICARYLYDKFGKERDMRRFPQQADYGDLTQEVMPEGAWEEEARRLDEEGFADAFRKFIRGGS